MARKATTPISPIQAQEDAAIFLSKIGAPTSSQRSVYSFTDKPIRLRGKRRDGQHRSHRCSATSTGSNKKGN